MTDSDQEKEKIDNLLTQAKKGETTGSIYSTSIYIYLL